MSGVSGLVNTISTTIVNPILALLFALGILVFIYGVVEFLIGLNQGKSNEVLKKGKQHMLWGLIGMFIMFAAVSILHFIAGLVCHNGGDWTTCVPPATQGGGGGWNGGGGGSWGGGGGSTGGGGGNTGGGGGSWGPLP